jgi:hypothetical protein
MLSETLSRIRESLMERVTAGHPTILLTRQDAWIVAAALGQLQEQIGMVNETKAFLDDASKKRRSKVSGLPAVVENVPKRLALPHWALPDILSQ